MSRLRSEVQEHFAQSAGNETRGQAAAGQQTNGGGLPSGLVMAGLLAVGVVGLAWYFFGADFKRYLHIERM